MPLAIEAIAQTSDMQSSDWSSYFAAELTLQDGGKVLQLSTTMNMNLYSQPLTNAQK